MAARYEITEQIAVISENDFGGSLELNKVRWNGKSEKWDLRRWQIDESGEHVPHSGVAMTDREWAMLQKILI